MTKPTIVYDNQTALDRIWAYAKVQKTQSSEGPASQGTACLYNGPDDNHCWVGILLEGIDIRPSDNSRDVDALLSEHDQVRERLEFCDQNFLRRCQAVHDDPNNWDYLDSYGTRFEKLRQVATDYNLKVPEETP
jgi:hypothetical protein